MKRKPLAILVILSLSLNLIGIVGSVIALQKKGGLPWLTRKLTEITTAKKGGGHPWRLPKQSDKRFCAIVHRTDGYHFSGG